MENKTTIGRLFGEEMISFTIPNYQRAYSWKVDKDGLGQVNMYLDDIINQPDNSDYFLGHYLFEETQENGYEIIDGQQRLTTTVIFMSRLVNELRRRGIEEFTYNGKRYAREQLYERYLKPRYGDRQKFNTVPGDEYCFNELIIECHDPDGIMNSGRKSEKRIREAANFFDKRMKDDQLEEETLYKWCYIIDNAVITTFVLKGESAKLTATQIFAFQNDRGLSLTTLEKLKAFLMHQIYRNDAANAITRIKSLEEQFTLIYDDIEKLVDTNEDTVLGYHCSAFLSRYEPPLDAIKHALQDETDKPRWISNFTRELRYSYSFMCEIEKIRMHFDSPIADVYILDKANSMPLVLKLCHYNSKGKDVRNIPAIDDALDLVEKILFKLTYTTGNYRTNSLITIAKNYKHDGYDQLIEELKHICDNGFQGYWHFKQDCLNYFIVNNYHYYTDLKYILYKYENSLRAKDRQPMLSPDECSNIFRDASVSNTLDHITPQNPDFTEYTDEFVENYLNNIGNLCLLTLRNNASKSNHNPADEKIMKRYDDVSYSNKEIYAILKQDGEWKEKQIEKRRDKIVAFIREKWEL